jgi:hypothetical protein
MFAQGDQAIVRELADIEKPDRGCITTGEARVAARANAGSIRFIAQRLSDISICV